MQSLKEPSLPELQIFVTLLGINTLLRFVQFIKARSPIDVTPSGIFILSSPVQYPKAPQPISVTLPGIETFLRLEHPEKTL